MLKDNSTMIIKLKEPVPDIGHDYYTPERILGLFTPKKQYIVCEMGLSGGRDNTDRKIVRLLMDAQERRSSGKRDHPHPVMAMGAPSAPTLYPLGFFDICDPELPRDWVIRIYTNDLKYQEKQLKELNIHTYFDLEALLTEQMSIQAYPQSLGIHGLSGFASADLEHSFKAHAYLTPIYHQQRRLNAEIEGYKNP